MVIHESAEDYLETILMLSKMIYERHQILSSWLIQLGVNKQTAEEDACRIEHDISKESFNAIKQAISEQLNNRQK